MPARSRPTTGRPTARSPSTFRTAPTWRCRPGARRSIGSVSSPEGTSSTFRASSPRTTPTRARAFRSVPGDTKLVLVGAAPYADALLSSIRAEAAGDPRILLPGAIYGEPYRELLSNAAVYVHATEVGGTHPALVEAMGFGRPLVVHDTPENREVAGEAALYVDARRAESLAAGLAALLSDPEARDRSGRAAAARARSRYRWDAVTDAYEALLAGSGRPPTPEARALASIRG